MDADDPQGSRQLRDTRLDHAYNSDELINGIE
jgi:hypothetical protein